MKMAKVMFRYRIVALLAVALCAGAVLLHPGCGGDEEPRNEAPGQVPATKYERVVGAAAYVPQDVSFYSSTLRAASRVMKIYESRAVQNIVKLPSVQQLIAQANANPQVRKVLDLLATHPLAVEGLPVLKDAVSNEIFVCTGPELPDTLAAAGRVYSGVVFGSIAAIRDSAASGDRPRADTVPPMLVESVLADREHLRVPSVLVGFKLTDVGRANAFLDKWLAKIPGPGKRIKPETVAGVSMHVLRLSGKDIPLGDLARDLEQDGVDARKADAMADYVRSLTLVVAVGVVDEYLIVSIGKDTSLLERWGKGASLARSAEFAPLRERFKPSLCDVSYASRAMVAESQWDRDDVRGLAHRLVSLIFDRAALASLKGVKRRLNKDVDEFVDGLSFAEPRNTLSFSFENRGVESYSFESASGSNLDASKPLTILAHRGKNPIGVYADRQKKNSDTYAWSVKWLKTAYEYVEDYVEPNLSPENRAEYGKAMAIVTPFLTSIDKTTREYILPATDGTQGLVVIDGGGTLAALPADWDVKMSSPFPVPRLGVAWKLNDARQFVEGMGLYRKAAVTLLEKVKRAYPSEFIAKLEFPPPKTSALAGGTLYSYGRIVNEMGDDVLPCALIKGNLLVMSSSKGLAAEMATPAAMPRNEITSPEGPAGAVALVNFDASNAYLAAVGESVFTMLKDNKVFSARSLTTALMVKGHVETILKSLKALRGYSSTTTIDDGWLIKHSWLHVEDIPK